MFPWRLSQIGLLLFLFFHPSVSFVQDLWRAAPGFALAAAELASIIASGTPEDEGSGEDPGEDPGEEGEEGSEMDPNG